MRLSESRAAAPQEDAVAARVVAAVDPALAALGSTPRSGTERTAEPAAATRGTRP